MHCRRITKNGMSKLEMLSIISVMMCTFESGFCDLTNEKSVDDFDWLLGHYTKTPTTGPNSDHTFGHGMF